MQVAKNFYLPTEKTYTRKIYELLLTMKIERLLSKEQILELYMNQIFLGQRAFGFAAASEIYFGKPVKDLSIAEAAMLAGLPVAPSASRRAISTRPNTKKRASRRCATGRRAKCRCMPSSPSRRHGSWCSRNTAPTPTRVAWMCT
jgi:membrane carboxypeptidase/penicillin-binding protein